MYWYYGIAIAVVVFLLVAYGMVIHLEAGKQIAKAPKDEMFICRKHGAIPKSSLVMIDINDMDVEYSPGRVERAKQIPYCPLCFEDRTKEARVQAGVK
jgi:hypothetical protein